MNGRVLIVDDEHDLAVACQRLLMRNGWQVTTVDRRQAALAALTAGEPPALAIVDAGFLGKPFSAHDFLHLVRIVVAGEPPRH